MSQIFVVALTKPLYWELLETSRHCQILCSSHLMKTDIIETMESYVIHGRLNKLETTEQPHIPVLIQDDQEGQNVDVVYPLVVHGPEGCGKSALAAVLANNSSCLDGWSKSFCVVRFIGASIHCRTEEQLVRSLVEQLGLLYEIPLSTIHRVSEHVSKKRQFLYHNTTKYLLNRLMNITHPNTKTSSRFD